VILGGKYTALTEVIRHVTLTEEYSCVLKSRSSVNLCSSNVCTVDNIRKMRQKTNG